MYTKAKDIVALCDRDGKWTLFHKRLGYALPYPPFADKAQAEAKINDIALDNLGD